MIGYTGVKPAVCNNKGKGTKIMSYKAEVIADASGQWVSNGLRFATEDEAKAYVEHLYSHWTLVRDTRVVVSDDPVIATWQDGGVKLLPRE